MANDNDEVLKLRGRIGPRGGGVGGVKSERGKDFEGSGLLRFLQNRKLTYCPNTDST